MPSIGWTFWELDSGEARHEESPDSFELPPRAERERLGVGQYPKLLFAIECDGDDGESFVQVERMWVVTTEVLDDTYIGLFAERARFVCARGGRLPRVGCRDPLPSGAHHRDWPDPLSTAPVEAKGHAPLAAHGRISAAIA